MKYLIKALIHELGGMLLIAALIGIIAGVVKLTYYLAGDDAPAVLLILVFVILQAKIILGRALELKRRDRK